MGLEKINTFVLDMDGTVYVGEKVIPGAVDFVKNVRANGKKIVFFTNNASRNKEIYFERLNKMGFQAEMSEIVSSGDVT
ncbi:MAG TPA: HAD family hydrolase, partial [Bacillota bacterium]|nr:HAD family hydrolase [Bacillota bacterium]